MTTSFHMTLARLSDESDPEERRRLSSILASEIETALNAQANRAQFALMHAEEEAYKHITRLGAQLDSLAHEVAQTRTEGQNRAQQITALALQLTAYIDQLPLDQRLGVITQIALNTQAIASLDVRVTALEQANGGTNGDLG